MILYWNEFLSQPKFLCTKKLCLFYFNTCIYQYSHIFILIEYVYIWSTEFHVALNHNGIHTWVCWGTQYNSSFHQPSCARNKGIRYSWWHTPWIHVLVRRKELHKIHKQKNSGMKDKWLPLSKFIPIS